MLVINSMVTARNEDLLIPLLHCKRLIVQLDCPISNWKASSCAFVTHDEYLLCFFLI